MRPERKEAVQALRGDAPGRDAAVSGLLGQVDRMRGVIDLQRTRLDAAVDALNPEVVADADSLTFGIARLLKASEGLRDLGVDVAEDLANFDQSFPNAIDIRDVLEHLDDYLIGAGKLQKKRGLPLTLQYRSNPTAGMAVMTTNPDLTFEIGQAIPAVQALAERVLGAGMVWIGEMRAKGCSSSDEVTLNESKLQAPE